MITENPIMRFSQWLSEAAADTRIAEPTAMCLATAEASGLPTARMVLLKAHDERGFVFYTNLNSRKSQALKQNPRAALCFHWMPLERQVRVEGNAELVSDKEADAYFASRPRDSQIGAWSSDQSQKLDSRGTFLARIAENTKRFEGSPVPRPPHWSGWRIVPRRIEFWHQVEFRLHLRDCYTREGDGWKMEHLYP